QATTKAFHYASLKQLQEHIKDYLWAYNSARPLRALKRANTDWLYPRAMA
ncbi:IS3 family transposase, partial [Pseudomonas asuensis]